MKKLGRDHLAQGEDEALPKRTERLGMRCRDFRRDQSE